MLKQPPPHDIQAEQAVICAMLINPDCRAQVKKSLSPKDFYSDSHQIIADVMLETRGDLLVIADELTKRGFLEKVGGKEYLGSLVDAISTSAGAEYHAGIIKEHATKRRLITLSQTLIDQAGRLSAEELSNYMRQGLNALDIRDSFGFRTGVDIENVYTPERMLSEYGTYIEGLKSNRFITGINEIDRRIRGVAGGEVLFIIARAGSFKTAILQNLLKGYVNHSSWGAVFFSLEMPIPSVTERFHEIVQGSTGRDIEGIYTAANKNGAGQIKNDLEENFVKELRNLFTVPVKVSIPDIAAYVRLIEKQFKVKVGVIGVDYLGLLDGPGQGEYEVVSKLARDIKGLAKLLNLPVVVIAQTSRKAGAGEIEITLEMGRGSGAIEECADFVLGLFQAPRPLGETGTPDPDLVLICKILKNRKGSKGSRWQLDLDATNLRIGPDAKKWTLPPRRTGDVF